MSELSFIEKLLAGVRVEWKPLGGVVLPTNNIRWRDAKRAYRYIDLTSVSIETKSINETSEIRSDNAPSRAQKLVEEGDVIFATTRPAQQRYCLIGPAFDGEIASTGYCVLRAKKTVILPKWIWHWVSSGEFKVYVEENQSGSAYPAISDAKVKEFQIPIPCPEDPEKSLEIQGTLVGILDTFSELARELNSELASRKQQYTYYRDQLLSFKEGEVDWKVLGETGEILRGTAITEKKTTPGEYPVVGNGPTHNYFHNKSNRCGETVVIARSGAYAGLVSYWNRPIFLTDAFSIHPDTTLLKTRFLYHVLKRDQSKIYDMGQGAGVPHVRAKDFESYMVPVPPIDEQARIVDILDRFDTLNNSNSDGLPCEIELRRKQYEYYRDLILSFPRPKAAA